MAPIVYIVGEQNWVKKPGWIDGLACLGDKIHCHPSLVKYLIRHDIKKEPIIETESFIENGVLVVPKEIMSGNNSYGFDIKQDKLSRWGEE